MLSALLLSAHLISVAAGVPNMDTAVPCYEPVPDDLAPLDGSVDVSPSAIPAMLAHADCGAGEIQVTLTATAGPASVVTVPVSTTGLYWLTDLPLAADTAYVLQATGADSVTAVSHFSTGHGPLPELSGAPAIAISGSTLASDGPAASVSLELTLVADPFGAVFTLARDGAPVLSGVNGPTTLVDSFGGSDGQEICYTLTQFNADGSTFATSAEACVTLAADIGDKVHGCSTAGVASGAGTAAVGLGALLTLARCRRRLFHTPAPSST